MKKVHFLFGHSKINSYICITKQLKNKTTMATKQTRPLYEIAREIKQDWKNVYFGAKPYLDAMATLNSVDDNYYFDTAKSVVLYFLGNAAQWRGENAKRIKKELRAMVGLK